jgi:hypothetical protein
MMQAVNAVIRSNLRMKAYYEGKMRRHRHNIAVTHVAAKMLRTLWHMLQRNRLYDERKERLYRSKLKRMARIV